MSRNEFHPTTYEPFFTSLYTFKTAGNGERERRRRLFSSVNELTDTHLYLVILHGEDLAVVTV